MSAIPLLPFQSYSHFLLKLHMLARKSQVMKSWIQFIIPYSGQFVSILVLVQKTVSWPFLNLTPSILVFPNQFHICYNIVVWLVYILYAEWSTMKLTDSESKPTYRDR